MGIPAGAAAVAELLCPVCAAQFTLAAAQRELPMATLAPVLPTPITDELGGEGEFLDTSSPTVSFAPAATVRVGEEVSADDFADFALAASGERRLEDDLFDMPAAPGAIEEFEVALGGVERLADDDDALIGEQQHEFELRPAPRARRRPSTVRMLVGVVGGGFGGLLLAAYALLWLRGADGDLFDLAQRLPQQMLPPSMRASGEVDSARSEQTADAGSVPDAVDAAADAAAAAPTINDHLDASAAMADEGVEVDPQVTPASNTEPATVADTVTPSEPTDTAAGSADADAAPAELPQAPPEPRWPTTPIVADLVDARLYSLAELVATVVDAEPSASQFIAGDLSKPDTVKPMGQAYIRLCALAERLTLTDPTAYGAELFTQQALAKTQLQVAAGNVARRRDLAVVAARWLQHAGRMNKGTLFVGRVVSIVPQGQWTEFSMEIAFDDQRTVVPVLMDGVPFSTGATAAIAGVIVADPQRHVAGYTGKAPQVVVAGYSFDPAAYADAEAPSAELTLPE